MPAITGDFWTSDEVIPVISLVFFFSLALWVFYTFDDSPNLTKTVPKYMLTKFSWISFRSINFRAGQLKTTKMPMKALAKGDTLLGGSGTHPNQPACPGKAREPNVLTPGSKHSLPWVPTFYVLPPLHYRALFSKQCGTLFHTCIPKLCFEKVLFVDLLKEILPGFMMG